MSTISGTMLAEVFDNTNFKSLYIIYIKTHTKVFDNAKFTSLYIVYIKILYLSKIRAVKNKEYVVEEA